MPASFDGPALFVDPEPTLGPPLFPKVEGFDSSESVKGEAAREMDERAERQGLPTTPEGTRT